ncbi:hypothetical protein [Cellulomonas sp. PhB150]|uniref:hypothetical protein n=1 Tax=Cellulomonas sp. PhB150 TaxID=2485188 RepID=UPI000F47C70C|nr:hypothetical protein [Cellulomonas sp. PhB150]ROS30637.1 hypothetical protein EDF34_0276 [Cellulomonas sp. PhB150]
MTSAAHDAWPDWADDEDEDDWPYGLDGYEHDGQDDDLPSTPGTPLTSAADVLDFLLPLIGPERAGPMALWCALVDEADWTLPVVLPIADTPVRPDSALVAALLRHLRDVLLDVFDAPDGGLVLAVVRRSGGDRGDVEMAWAAALERAAAQLDLRVRAIAAVGRDRARVLRW